MDQKTPLNLEFLWLSSISLLVTVMITFIILIFDLQMKLSPVSFHISLHSICREQERA